MLRGLFVTGTDTNVGKTVVSAALLSRFRSRAAVRYWKPIQTGIEQDDDTAEVKRLSGAKESELRCEGIRLQRPVSPHLAARWNGVTIDLKSLTSWVASADAGIRWIVEGAGGVLVPVNESETMLDLIRLLALPVVVVARSSLGTINHALLTLEALRTRALSVAGVILVGDKNRDNRDAIEKYGDVAVLGEMPRFDPFDPEQLARWASAELDPENILAEYFR